MKAFMGNGYPRSFIRSASVPRPPRERDGETEEERPPTVHLPYVAGVSERIRRVCRDFNIRAVFKSGPTLRSLLAKVKDPLPREKQANVVYEVPCTCGKVYKSAIAEHAWTEDHPIRWDDTRILQHASRSMELVVKEAICMRTAPESSHFNHNGGSTAGSPHTGSSRVAPTQAAQAAHTGTGIAQAQRRPISNDSAS